jgi:trimeric autotransporter adhesin
MPVVITGNNTPTAGGVTYGDGTTYANTAAGTAGQVLTSAGVSAPAWANPASVNLATGVTGTLPIANGGTNSTATATAGGAGYGTGTAHAYTAAGTAGQFLQSNGASAPTWATVSAGVTDNVVVVHTFSGYGSTNTAISIFTTNPTNTGSAITYASSSSLGASFTINEAGYYLVYTVASPASSVAFGASINSSQLSTGIASITFANRVLASAGGGSSSFAMYNAASIIIKCAVSDVIRPHCTPGYNQNGTSQDVFIVRKVGNV